MMTIEVAAKRILVPLARRVEKVRELDHVFLVIYKARKGRGRCAAFVSKVALLREQLLPAGRQTRQYLKAKGVRQ